MLKKITIKNFRTHADVTIALDDVVLFVGGNNAGKTNLLVGINYFSKIVSRSYPLNKWKKEVLKKDYYANVHRSSKKDDPIEFACVWEKDGYEVDYKLIIYPSPVSDSDEVLINCKESISVKGENIEIEEKSGYDEPSKEIALRKILSEKKLDEGLNKLIDVFFLSISSAFYYKFQPTLLNTSAIPLKYNKKIRRMSPVFHRDYRSESVV